jgi:CheY-like chemotaxis protein
MMREDAPRLILLDLMMPGMNGFTVISHLQKDASLRKIPVIVLSSLDVSSTTLAQIPSVYHTIQKGSLEFLQIRDRIREILGLEEDSDSPASPQM